MKIGNRGPNIFYQLFDFFSTTVIPIQHSSYCNFGLQNFFEGPCSVFDPLTMAESSDGYHGDIYIVGEPTKSKFCSKAF